MSAAEGIAGLNLWQVTVETSVFLGEARHYLLAAGDFRLRSVANATQSFAPGQRVTISMPPDNCVAVPQEQPVNGRADTAFLSH